MATTTHLQHARLPFRVDLNPVETLRAIGSGEPHNPPMTPAIAPVAWSVRRRTNHWTGWRKRAKVAPRRT